MNTVSFVVLIVSIAIIACFAIYCVDRRLKMRKMHRDSFYIEHDFYMVRLLAWLEANQADMSHPQAQDLLLHAVGALNTYCMISNNRDAHRLLMHLLEFIDDGEISPLTPP